MKEFFLCTALILTSIVHGTDENYACGGDDWIAYKDEKCVKLFKFFLTRHQAEEVCNQQGPATGSFAPSLVTINSAAEQKFLTEYIFESTDSNNVWIGAERRLDNITEFNWNDGSTVQRFTNWATGHPTDDVRRSCVHMKSPFTRDDSEMRWVDVSCTSGNWFICQKFQAWPIEHFQQIILNMRRELQDLASDLSANLSQITDLRSDVTASQLQITVSQSQITNLQANPVPIGFIYVQLPNQPEPQNTWPTVAWTEITSQYVGLFFRVLGGSSAAFGSVQEESSPRLTHVQRSNLSVASATQILVPTINEWSAQISTGATFTGTHQALRFFTSVVETRPRNQAIRIWRRI